MLFKGTSVEGKPAAAAVCAVAALFLEADGWAFVSHSDLAKDSDMFTAAQPIVALWTQGELSELDAADKGHQSCGRESVSDAGSQENARWFEETRLHMCVLFFFVHIPVCVSRSDTVHPPCCTVSLHVILYGA